MLPDLCEKAPSLVLAKERYSWLPKRVECSARESNNSKKDEHENFQRGVQHFDRVLHCFSARMGRNSPEPDE
jgi:hypothetical protein